MIRTLGEPLEENSTCLLFSWKISLGSIRKKMREAPTVQLWVKE